MPNVRILLQSLADALSPNTGTSDGFVDNVETSLARISQALPEKLGGKIEAESLAAEYDDQATYDIGDYCTHDGVFYICATAITTAEPWNSAKWVAVPLIEILQEKLNAPADGAVAGRYLMVGQNGEPVWDQLDESDIRQSVYDWLSAHPEAIVVNDGTITRAKLDTSVGQAVDEIDDLSSDVSELKADLLDLNIINPTKVENQYVRYSDGAFVSSSSYSYMEATGISVYEVLRVHTNNPKGATAICFYKADGTWISSIRTTGETSPYLYDAVIDVPEGADIIRVSCLKAYLSDAGLNTALKEHLNALKETINEKTDENKNYLHEAVEDIEICAIPIFYKTNSGYLGGTGAVIPATANREVYTDLIPVTEGDILYIDHATNTSGASMWFCYCLYDSNETIIGSRIDLVSSVVRATYTAEITIPSNAKYIRFTYRTFNTATLYLSKNWTVLNEKIQNVTNETVEIITTWETGGIRDDGAEVATSTYIRSDYIDLSNIGWITFSPVNGYRYCTRWYDANKNYLLDHEGNDETPITTGRFFDLTNDTAKYLRIVIGTTSSNNPTLSDGYKAGEVAYTLLKGEVNALEKAVNIGSGTDFYNGEKIVLSDENVARYRCSIDKWKDFTNISEYSLHLNQSMDIFKDYVFLLSDGAPTVIMDYNTKQIVSVATMPQQANSHYNSAQFSNIYYDENDEFPMLFTAQCNFNLEDACLIYRVTRSGTTFAFSLVNSIRINVLPTYQLSWAIDNYSKKLVCTGYYNGSYNVEENNPVITYAWDIPSKADILSGTQIILEPLDAKEYSSIKHGTIQDIFCYNNKLFMGYQPTTGGRCVYVLDIAQNRIVSKVTMTDAVRELEGLCIYDGKMFVCQKDGTDAAGTNPLTIWVVDFD